VIEGGARPGLGAEILHLELPGLALGGSSILDRIDLRLHLGETAVLTGPSGIGKSTLLRVIAGLETRHQGRLRAPAKMAMVFQEPTLLRWRTLRDNLILPLGITAQDADHALSEVGLAGRGDMYPDQLSLGQGRRLALARAFAAKPDLLLMDEPFVSLDAALVDEMMTLFEVLRDRYRVTTLMVTHSQSEADRLGTRILEMTGSPAFIKPDLV
jgi:NitT/TauT family transport system ATP-binding protein